MYLAFKLAWQNSELEHSVFSTRQGVHLSIHSADTLAPQNKKNILESDDSFPGPGRILRILNVLASLPTRC